MFITNTSNTKQNEPWCYRMVECLAKFPRQICRENATTKFNDITQNQTQYSDLPPLFIFQFLFNSLVTNC